MMRGLLNWQGMAGIGVAIALLIMLTVQKLETVHWKKQSESFEQLYQQEQAAFATTVANARIAADAARTADRANAERVAAEQRDINERTADDFEKRLADARARAAAADRRLRAPGQAAADSGAGAAAPVPSLPAAARAAAQSADQDRLPEADRLTATEQAIQLDELIKWVKAQARVDPNAP